MEHVKDTSQRAAEAMSQGSVPCTSAEAMLPLTSQNFAEAGASALRHSGAQSSVMLSAMLGVFILAAAAAFFLYRKLEKQEVARHAGAGHVQIPARFRRKAAQAEKPVSAPEEVRNGVVGGGSAPETPEQVLTPKQDRHGSRSLDEEGEFDAASVASLPAQSPMGHSAAQAPGRGASVAARAPIQEDEVDGEAHHRWPDGSEYFGEWHGGQPSGRGIFVWPSGMRYEGEWRNGQEHGVGTLVEPDGSAYYGFWSQGKLHGEGVYKPKSADVIIMRDYLHGEKVKEATLRYGQVDVHKKEVKDKAAKAARTVDKKAAARDRAEPVRPGETIYKGHHSYDLMRNLQLGIIFSIAKSVEQPTGRGLKAPVTDEDFAQQVTQYFPRGEQNTSFKWKDYCPCIFSRLREAFGIDNKDYLLSLAGDKALREMPSPGKSGSVFFLSDDDRFLIKTVSHEEMLLLLKLIPAYYRHCAENPTTLLTRFFGVHRIKPLGSQSKVRFVVMGNVFPTEVRLHRKYDLKGSTHGRTAGSRRFTEPDTILKDLDVDMRLALQKRAHAALIKQIEADTALLAQMGVMDYSLLLGVHYPKWGETAWYPPAGNHTDKENRDVKEVEQTPLEPTAAHPESNGTLNMAKGQTPERRRLEQANGKSYEQADQATAMQASAAGAGQATKGSEGREAEAAAGNSKSSSSSAQKASLGSHGVAGRQQRYTQLLNRALQDSGERQEDASPFSRAAAAGEPKSPSAAHFTSSAASAAAIESPFKEASSLGFDGKPAQKRAFPDANGDSRASVDRVDYSSFAQQKRSSIELGMGNISHTANINPSAGAGGLRAGRMMSLHSALRAQMGVAVPALSVPKEESRSSEPCLLFFGIVDFLQQYNLRKKGEHAFKSLVMNSKTISVVDPESYAERFCKSARDLFVTRGADLDIKTNIKPKS